MSERKKGRLPPDEFVTAPPEERKKFYNVASAGLRTLIEQARGDGDAEEIQRLESHLARFEDEWGAYVPNQESPLDHK